MHQNTYKHRTKSEDLTSETLADSEAAQTHRTITSIDLFAGAGGLSLGFHLAELGYLPVYAVEHELAAAKTFERNFGCEVFAGDIEESLNTRRLTSLSAGRLARDSAPRA